MHALLRHACQHAYPHSHQACTCSPSHAHRHAPLLDHTCTQNPLRLKCTYLHISHAYLFIYYCSFNLYPAFLAKEGLPRWVPLHNTCIPLPDTGLHACIHTSLHQDCTHACTHLWNNTYMCACIPMGQACAPLPQAYMCKGVQTCMHGTMDECTVQKGACMYA